MSFRFGTLNRDLTPAVAEAMLSAVKQTVNSQIFQDVEARRHFLSTCCAIVKKYLLAGQQLSVCAEILGEKGLPDFFSSLLKTCNIIFSKSSLIR